jgi:hypothetical protein
MNNHRIARRMGIPGLRSSAILALVLMGMAPCTAAAANWPSWRGPHGDGTVAAKNLPETWTAEQNIKWKRELPAWSASSPIIWGDRIFVISPSQEKSVEQAEPANLVGSAAVRAQRDKASGRRAATSGPGGQEILLLCL